MHSTDTTLSYALDNMNFTKTMVFQGLSGGQHKLYIRNDAGCLDSMEIFLAVLPLPTFTLITSPEQCNLHNGSITVGNLTGIPPLRYALDGSTWQTTPAFDSLSAGIYIVQVQDSSGCIVKDSISVAVTGQPVISQISTTKAQCGMDDGSIEVSASSDRSTLEYALNGSIYAPNPIFTGLPAGTYLISVRDTFGCIIQQNAFVESLYGPVIDDIQTTPEYCGMANGTISIMATSGYGALTYAIDGGTFSVISVFSGLAAGNHMVSVQDSNGCLTEADITVDAVSTVRIQSLVPDDATCNMDNGRILVISPQLAINGYSIDHVHFQGGPMFSHLVPGTYTVYLKSHDVCIDSATTTVGRIHLL